MCIWSILLCICNLFSCFIWDLFRCINDTLQSLCNICHRLYASLIIQFCCTSFVSHISYVVSYIYPIYIYHPLLYPLLLVFALSLFILPLVISYYLYLPYLYLSFLALSLITYTLLIFTFSRHNPFLLITYFIVFYFLFTLSGDTRHSNLHFNIRHFFITGLAWRLPTRPIDLEDSCGPLDRFPGKIVCCRRWRWCWGIKLFWFFF